METLIASLGALAIGALVIWWVRSMVRIWGAASMSSGRRSGSRLQNPHAGHAIEGSSPELMNEGDFHSGPYGYSPNTAYPETQYGSGFDEEAEWNQ